MSSVPLFSDRADAGEQLAQVLVSQIAEWEMTTHGTVLPVVYALPRGGIPVAAPVARRLHCPLDIIVAKKITTPQNPELAIGAVTSEGQVLWAQQRLWGKLKPSLRHMALHQAQDKAQAQLAEFAPDCPLVNPQGRLALVVDDGIATGMTMVAATQAVKEHHPQQIWICTPVAPAGLIKWLSRFCDRLVILETPDDFLSVSRFYVEFPQVNGNQALAYLKTHNQMLQQQ